MLLIAVEDPSLKQVRVTRDQLVTLLRTNLRDLQLSVNVKPKDQITSKVISSEGDVKVSHRPTQRAILVAVVAGLGLTFGLATLVDTWRRTRRRRRAGLDDTETDEALLGALDPDDVDGAGTRVWAESARK